MPDATPAAAPGPRGGAPSAGAATVYRASGLRKTVLAFAVLLLLPFFLSLPVMLAQRLIKGVLFDAWGLIVIALAFTAIMALLAFELVYSLRASVEIGETGFRYTLPRSRGLLLPMLHYRSATVPYAQVEAVEIRREIYGGAIVPVMLRGARVLTKEGQTHQLGYVSEAEVDPLFPVPEIARRIAERSGIEVTDHGSVWRLATLKMLGIRRQEPAGAPVTEEDIARLNRRHNAVMVGLAAAMVALLAAGINADFQSGTVDRGERARDAVQRAPDPTREAPAQAPGPRPPAARGN